MTWTILAWPSQHILNLILVASMSRNVRQSCLRIDIEPKLHPLFSRVLRRVLQVPPCDWDTQGTNTPLGWEPPSASPPHGRFTDRPLHYAACPRQFYITGQGTTTTEVVERRGVRPRQAELLLDKRDVPRVHTTPGLFDSLCHGVNRTCRIRGIVEGAAQVHRKNLGLDRTAFAA